ncbi:O-antigen ligase family protein [Desulfobotulus mexicanus]|nr:O-antigen ligase family protein [Desulfobotulus mexicanus]
MSFLLKMQDSDMINKISVGLIVSFLVLIPFSRISEISVVLMALSGLFLIIKYRTSLFKEKGVVLFSFVYISFWIPVVLSIIGAVNPEKTFVVALAFLRFYLMGIFIVYTMKVVGVSEKILRIFAFILLFWVMDALLQAVLGYNVFGYSDIDGRINGIFGNNLNMGSYLATMSPLLLVYSYLKWPLWGQGIAFFGVTSIVFLAGSRNGWIILAVVLFSVFIWIIRRDGLRKLPFLGVIGLVVGLAIMGSMFFSSSFSERFQQSVLVFSHDSDQIDQAVSNRLPIWHTAFEVFKANPVNGVGARNLRYAYENYAPQDDFFMNNSLTVHHAHLLLLDIASETGIIGIFGLLFAMGFMFKFWLKSSAQHRLKILPYGLVVMVVFLPFNSHYALYSTAWSTVYFWLIALYCGAAGEGQIS